MDRDSDVRPLHFTDAEVNRIVTLFDAAHGTNVANTVTFVENVYNQRL